DVGTSPALFSDDGFGEAIELLMGGLGITYRELADRTGLSAGYLNHIVHGSRPVPDRPLLAQIAKALGADPDFFLDCRLMKVVEALGDRPELVDELFARFDDQPAGQRAGKSPASAPETVEAPRDVELTGQAAH